MKFIFLCLFIVACDAITVKDPKRKSKVVCRGRQTKPVSKLPKPTPDTEASQYEVIEIIDEPDCCQSNFKKEPFQYPDIVEDESISDDSDNFNDGLINNDSSYDEIDNNNYGLDDGSDDGSHNDGNNSGSISDVSVLSSESDDDNYGTISDDDGDTTVNQNINITGDNNNQNIDQSNSSGNENNNGDNNADNIISDNNNSVSNKGSNNESDNDSSDGSNGNDDGFEFTGKVRTKGRITIQAHFNGGCDSNTGTDYTIAYKRNDNDCNSGNQGNGCSSQQFLNKNTYSPYMFLPPVTIPHFYNIIGSGVSGSGKDCGVYENGAVGYPCVGGCSSGQGNKVYGFNCLGSAGSGSIRYPLLGYDYDINGLFGYPLLGGANGYAGNCGPNGSGANVYSNSNCYCCGSLPKTTAQGLVTIAGKF